MKHLLWIIAPILMFSLENNSSQSFKSKKKEKEPKELLLQHMRELIEQKKNLEISKLEQDQNIKKREKANILKKRNRLDHIKVIGNNRTIYLQLENSTIFFRTYLFNQNELDHQLDELSKKNVLEKIIEIDVYLSRKFRRHFLLKSFYTYDDLYSSAIRINTDI